jgi:hypothetical protein
MSRDRNTDNLLVRMSVMILSHNLPVALYSD